MIWSESKPSRCICPSIVSPSRSTYIHIHTYIHTYIRARIHTRIHTHTYVHTCTHTIIVGGLSNTKHSPEHSILELNASLRLCTRSGHQNAKQLLFGATNRMTHFLSWTPTMTKGACMRVANVCLSFNNDAQRRRVHVHGQLAEHRKHAVKHLPGVGLELGSSTSGWISCQARRNMQCNTSPKRPYSCLFSDDARLHGDIRGERGGGEPMKICVQLPAPITARIFIYIICMCSVGFARVSRASHRRQGRTRLLLRGCR